MIRVAVIGAGSFGSKRAIAVQSCRNASLVGVADLLKENSKRVAEDLGVEVLDMEEVYDRQDIDAVIVAVPNKFHMPVTIKALEGNKHVLCEKPLSRTVEEAEAMVLTASKAGKLLKTGSNHRYFESVKKAYEVLKSGVIGDIISFNGRIGNNGERLQNSWFVNKELSGGGTLLDNGCHLLDIARWFMGDFVHGLGMTSNVYWKNCSVEDSATGIFKTSEGKIATINSSWRQLSGYIHFEVNGTDGYITVDGRFDSHGGDNVYWQSLSGNKQIHCINFGHVAQNSYVEELEEFFDAVQHGREPTPSGKEGVEVVKMVQSVYASENHYLDLIYE
jgi:predicted dehydrogenase